MTEEHDHDHSHDQPPRHLGPPVDPSLPQREIMTPMGVSFFRDATLEEQGYRYSFSKKCNEKMVEIVYLKEDGTTGTVIADLESLFDTKIIVNDENKAMCRVTFKLLREVTNPVSLQCADVPVDSISNGMVGNMLRKLLDHFLKQVYGRQEATV